MRASLRSMAFLIKANVMAARNSPFDVAPRAPLARPLLGGGTMAATTIARADVPRVVGQAREQMISGLVENLHAVAFADSVEHCQQGA
jgi:hypothetical protein